MRQKWIYKLLILITLFSCVNEYEREIEIKNGETIHFTVEIPGIATASTRSMDGVKENEIEAISVLVFDASNQFIEKKDGSNIVQSGSDNVNVSFEATVSTGTGRSIVVVANAKTILDALTLSVGQPKSAVLQQLKYTMTGKWASDSAGAYTPIPMVGEKTGVSITSGGSISGINLIRMLARIDMKVTTSDFKLKKIHLCNYNTNGYITPAWDTNGTIQTSTITTPNLPSNTGKNITNPLTYDTSSAQIFEGEIYTFENNMASDVNGIDHVDRKNATCLVVEGEYNGATYFYRIDFTENTSVSDPTTVAYMPLLRNHKYIISITSAAGVGYASLNEALSSYTIPSNLKTRLIYYDMGEVKDIAYDGQYFLGVSNKEIELPRNEQVATSEGNTLIVTTDNPTGWRIENINTISGASGWLTTDITTGPSTTTGTSVNLLASSNTTGSSRIAEINFIAGRITYTVKVTQTITANLLLEIKNTTDNIISELLFASGAGRVTSAQSFKIVWEPQDLTVSANLAVANANAFIYHFGSDTPGSGSQTSIISPTGEKTFNITPQPIVVTDLTGEPFLERASYVNFTITDGINSKTKSFLLKHSAYNLVVDTSYYRTDGKCYSFIVRSNVAWRIKSVSETLITGTKLLNISSSDNLKVGTTGGPNINGEEIFFTTVNNLNVKGTVNVVFESPTGLLDDITITLNLKNEGYYPSFHRGWAGSNIYWDGSKMTFDDTGRRTHENYQGLFFKWGSLWGINPYRENSGYSGQVYKFGYTSVQNGGPYSNIPFVTPTVSSDRNRHYLLEVHDPDNNIGDICKYITEQAGGTLYGKKWRMPTSYEFGADGDLYTQKGTWPLNQQQNDKNDGTYVIPGNPGYTKSEVGYPFFPAAGFYSGTNVNSIGTSGGYWSGSSKSSSKAYYLSFISNKSTFLAASATNPSYAMPVRCVQE
ncbi:fimbrial protein [Massilibacteroides sp.]|uniref:fimbrial protein n=1 Tax=Massilibacteroides sp. TaxID=2034766 RepID=UPI0026225E5D|nr:fimbrial protein [Massilibacteroides sp.]MDD4516845.1 fimbrial protein [Massilibacteroides sp.]